MRDSTVHEGIANSIVEFKYTPTNDVKADGLTKGHQRVENNNFCSQIKIDVKLPRGGTLERSGCARNVKAWVM